MWNTFEKTLERSVLSCNETKFQICEQYYRGTNDMCCMGASLSKLKASKCVFDDFECKKIDWIHKLNFLVAHTICSNSESETVAHNSMCYTFGSRGEMCGTFNKKKMKSKSISARVVAKRQIIFSASDINVATCNITQIKFLKLTM